MAQKQLIPQQFLFRFSFDCKYRAKMPTSGAHVVDLSSDYRLPFLGAMDSQREYADLRVAWNESGLGFQWEVRLKREPIYGEPERPTTCDGLSVWLDMRDTRTIHRASRYCQRFLLLAHKGEGVGHPEVAYKPIHRALEDAPSPDLSQIRIARFSINEDGEPETEAKSRPVTNYRMEAFLPANVLSGFDPETNHRLGFCYRLRDRELGDQFLAAGPEFPYWEDPSLWSTLELKKEEPAGGKPKRAKR
ncbi:MAG: hypothetical protein U1D30_15780 [Planctomycetota bacterium]